MRGPRPLWTGAAQPSSRRISSSPFGTAQSTSNGSSPSARYQWGSPGGNVEDVARSDPHLFAIGEHEIASLPTTSAWADRYGCEARVRRDDIVDGEAGYAHAGGNQNPGSREWGLLPRPGTAEVFDYPGCSGGRVVADVIRIDKGHTEGLAPRVTEELVRLMTSATGGKIRSGQ